MTTLMELPYLPPIAWCAQLWQSETPIIEAHEHYQKGSFRNRCHIAGPNGIQRLSIPLDKGKHQQLPIKEVRISYAEPWQMQHWKSIVTAYGSSPFFEHYAPLLAPFYQKKYAFLFDWNYALLQFLMSKWNYQKEFVFSETYLSKDVLSKKEGWIDLRGVYVPKDEHHALFFHPTPYPQVFLEKHGFIPNLSALDLLFCWGRQSVDILTKSYIHPNSI